MRIRNDKIRLLGFRLPPRYKQWFSSGFSLIIVVIVFLFSYATYTRNKFWQQDQIRFWEEVTKKSPAKFRPHYNLSEYYDKQDRLVEAVRELLIAISLDPNNAKAHNNLGWIYSKQNHLEEAVKEFKIAIRLDPNHYLALKNLQAAYESLDEFDEAERARKNADAVYHYEKGRLLAEQGHLEEAIRELQISLILNPDCDAANREISVLYSQGMGSGIRN